MARFSDSRCWFRSAPELFSDSIPAMQVSHSSLGETLKETGRGTTSGRGGRAVRAGLVVAEVAISLVLLVGAGLLLRSFVKIDE